MKKSQTMEIYKIDQTFLLALHKNGHKFLDHSELFIDPNENDHMRVRTHRKLKN